MSFESPKQFPVPKKEAEDLVHGDVIMHDGKRLVVDRKVEGPIVDEVRIFFEGGESLVFAPKDSFPLAEGGK